MKTPYNFVPLSKEVVSPGWINDISHDKPFPDGRSGEFNVKITAHTPIFVRDSKESYTFSNHEGKFFIPGSSIKGMLRNVVEIMSFGRILDKVNDHRFALRSLTRDVGRSYLAFFTTDNIFCGWLTKRDDKYVISSCGIPGRISLEKIDEHFGTKMQNYFLHGTNGGFDPGEPDHKSARHKYEKFFNDLTRLKAKFRLINPNHHGKKIYEVDPEGDKKGEIIFTGQPSFRKLGKDGKWEGHFYEFIFFEGNENEYTIEEKVFADFLFAYHDHDKNKWSIDWQYWCNELYNERRVPVFFQKDENGHVESLGLSYLYKLPYKFSVPKNIKNFQKEKAENPDLSDAIFGYISKNSIKTSLKGRVHIGHATCVGLPNKLRPVKAILSSPKASFYPNYIDNSEGIKYKTYMDDAAVISGWKRYIPMKDTTIQNGANNNNEISTTFTPLDKGSVFEFKIRYHNLLSVELGALLSAITFHNSPNLFHSLGMGKPYGYGKVKLEIEGIDPKELKDCLKDFESFINAGLKNTQPKWHRSEQMRELATMASGFDGIIEYLTLPEHNDVKSNRARALKRFSSLSKPTVEFEALSDAESINSMKEQYFDSADQGAFIEKVRSELNTQFNHKKSELLKIIEEKLKGLKEEEKRLQEEEEKRKREEKKQESSLKANKDGIVFEEHKVNNWRNFQDSIIRTVNTWLRNYYGGPKMVPSDKPEGNIPEPYREQVVVQIRKLYEIFPAREKQIMDSGNGTLPIAEKMKQWFGSDYVQKIKFKE